MQALIFPILVFINGFLIPKALLYEYTDNLKFKEGYIGGLIMYFILIYSAPFIMHSGLSGEEGRSVLGATLLIYIISIFIVCISVKDIINKFFLCMSLLVFPFTFYVYAGIISIIGRMLGLCSGPIYFAGFTAGLNVIAVLGVAFFIKLVYDIFSMHNALSD